MSTIYLRARDVRNYIKEHGTEKGLTLALEKLCEENTGYRQALIEMAAQLNTALDIIGQFTTVGDGIQKRMAEIERREQQYAATTDVTSTSDRS